jgi:isopropylmalate/homocitrate/citramalate synthase
MTRSEFHRYVLEHREDDEALSIYVERFRDPNAKVYPSELSNTEVEKILREHLEQRRNQA